MEKFEENENDKTGAGVEIDLNSQGGCSIGDKLQGSCWQPCEVDWESAVHTVKAYEINMGTYPRQSMLETTDRVADDSLVANDTMADNTTTAEATVLSAEWWSLLVSAPTAAEIRLRQQKRTKASSQIRPSLSTGGLLTTTQAASSRRTLQKRMRSQTKKHSNQKAKMSHRRWIQMRR